MKQDFHNILRERQVCYIYFHSVYGKLKNNLDFFYVNCIIVLNYYQERLNNPIILEGWLILFFTIPHAFNLLNHSTFLQKRLKNKWSRQEYFFLNCQKLVLVRMSQSRWTNLPKPDSKSQNKVCARSTCWFPVIKRWRPFGNRLN